MTSLIRRVRQFPLKMGGGLAGMLTARMMLGGPGNLVQAGENTYQVPIIYYDGSLWSLDRAEVGEVVLYTANSQSSELPVAVSHIYGNPIADFPTP